MSELEQLKNLLFGHERKTLDDISKRIETRETRIRDVADVLPAAITRSYADDANMGRALKEPLENFIGDAVRRDPKAFSDALFPVMGPAIRKAIAEALKSMVQSVNTSLETSLSPSMRFRAWRAGMPLGQYVLQQNLIYRVEEAYLINPVNGLLISHVFSETARGHDEDAVSAMLTVIQDFVGESFSHEKGAELEVAEVGDSTLIVGTGPYARIACVVWGVPPVTELRGEIQAILEHIHLKHGERLRQFSGTPGGLPGVDADLSECLNLQQETGNGEAEKSAFPWPMVLLLIVLLAAVGYWIVSGLVADRRASQWRAALDAAPGIVTTQVVARRGEILARGLRDPLSSDPLDLAGQAGLGGTPLKADFAPYQSLEPDIVLVRARQALSPPDTIHFDLKDRVLTVRGSADAEWIRRARLVAGMLAGVDAVDITAVTADDATLLQALISRLQPPPSVRIEVNAARVRLSGTAPARWIATLPANIRTVAGVVSSDATGLVAIEQGELDRVVASIDGQAFYFSQDDELVLDKGLEVDATAGGLRRAVDLAKRLDRELLVTLTGLVDGLGDEVTNQRVRRTRAERIRDLLVAAGVDSAILQLRTDVPLADIPPRLDPELRKTRLDIAVTDKHAGSPAQQ